MSDMNALYLNEATDLSEDFFLKHEKALKGTEERFLNGDNNEDEGWKSEALAGMHKVFSNIFLYFTNNYITILVIADISNYVKQIDISSDLPCDDNGVYLNLETQEGASLTVELSCAGFRVCGYQFNKIEEDPLSTSNKTNVIPLNVYYETPYALLDSISPAYRDSFSNELAQRLQELCK